MPTRIAINGFGRIGRAVVRSAIERDAHGLLHQAKRPVTVIPDAATDRPDTTADAVDERVGV
jgi:glyceraldehyde-3-phosphate dehydrogenase/erythrose-4-phosphate dehydrogenase